MINFFKRVKVSVYEKLFKINDSPQRIAAGFGLGIFFGMLPGTGPLAALFFAFVFKVNRASALLASLLTNTWLSLVTFVFSIKVGSAILGVNWHLVYDELKAKMEYAGWQELLKTSFENVLFPAVLGYFTVSVFLGALSYLAVLFVIKAFKHQT